MRKAAILVVGVCCIAVGGYLGVTRGLRLSRSSDEVRVLPGIGFVFTRDENAADYYARACQSISRRYPGEEEPQSLTRQERKWFILGSSCRRSSWYPEHYPHVKDPNDESPEFGPLRDLARLMAREGHDAEKAGDVKKAIDIWKRVAVLGWHTETEEECVVEVLTGIAVETIAYSEFIRYYRERGNTDKARRYGGFKQRLLDHIMEFGKLTVENEADYRRVKDIALAHKSPLWRKGACTGLAYYCANVDESFRQDAAETLRAVSSEDSDAGVRETARNMALYVAGVERLPE